jgi:hypothetical protein
LEEGEMARHKPGMVSGTVYIDETTYKGLKKLAVDRGVPVGDLLNSIIKEWWLAFPEREHYEPPKPEEETLAVAA